jgi:hypothetical protein
VNALAVRGPSHFVERGAGDVTLSFFQSPTLRPRFRLRGGIAKALTSRGASLESPILVGAWTDQAVAADPRADDAQELGDGESLSHVLGRADDDGNAARRRRELAADACAPKRAGLARREVATRRWCPAYGTGGNGGWVSNSKEEAGGCLW